MMRKTLTGLAAALVLTLSATAGANQPETAQPAAQPAMSNPFDPNVWMAAFTGSTPPTISGEVEFNAAHPSAWMSIVDPSTHMQMHAMFANPASYTQFMQPQFYMEFMKPENMMAWMNPASYQVMMQQQTMNYWMNPNSYMHAMDPAMYQQAMNPANYMVYMNPNTYTALLTAQTCDSADPNAAPTWFGC
jgi:hypothetical protein